LSWSEGKLKSAVLQAKNKGSIQIYTNEKLLVIDKITGRSEVYMPEGNMITIEVIPKGVYEINVHGIDKNGRGYDDSLDIRVLNESDLVATSSNIFSDDGQSSSISSGVTTSNYSPTLFKYSGSTVLKVYEEKFIEFSSFTKNAKEVKCYLAPTSNMTNGVIYDAENAELVQEKNGCHIKGLKQGRVFLYVEVTEESGEKHKGIILVIILNEM
ncbi:MAG: hypothetical protein IIX89_03550, partial [Oscillospiraceae bacterium]|nr:hypothetical protein [Oscillospiraceae bacterium]